MAFARETEDPGRRTQEGYRGMCSAPVDAGGEVRGCSVGCILGMSEVSPFVFIAASYQVHGTTRTEEMLFQAGVFWVRRFFGVF